VNPYHEDWTEFAACRSIGEDLWYPEVGEPTWKQARQVCQSCPVMWQCLDWVMRVEHGLDRSNRFGVTGGMTPSQRADYQPQWLAEQEGAA
jgi:hypothetical protein